MNTITMKLQADHLIEEALREDISSEDVTTNSVMKESVQGEVNLICKQDGIIAGLEVFKRVFELLDANTKIEFYKKDGDAVKSGELLGVVTGDIRVLLSGERVALNYLQRMSGIATYTKSVAKLLAGTKTKLLDTRKTTPNMRIFEKYAVRVGGGYNHRYNLSDGVLLKDNHIGAAGSVTKAVQMAKDYAALGVKVIHVEDMAGMMNPKQVSDVIRAIRKEVGLPVHFHAHCIGGMADICYWEAIKAGACTVDCDVSALSLGPAHPPVESIVTCLKGTGFDPHLDMDLLAEINDYFMKLREKYKEFASKRTGVDISVLKHQIPGGMLSNLESQLKGMNAENRINEVFEEVHKVHKDFGYPPLATPFAQMVGAQATINVLTGQRYKMISNESKTYIRGMYGRPAGEIAPELKAAVLGNDKMITERPGSLIAPGWEKAKAEAAGFARTEEDVMTYALFPELAPAFLQKKYQ